MPGTRTVGSATRRGGTKVSFENKIRENGSFGRICTLRLFSMVAALGYLVLVFQLIVQPWRDGRVAFGPKGRDENLRRE